LRLRKAVPDQAQDRDRLTHEAWGQRLTIEQFVARETRLRGHPFATAGMTSWQLVDDDDRVLSSCETFRMRSRIDEHDGHTYGVASVFTEGRLRGRGLATQMLDRVMSQLVAEDPRAQASILFSDVGAPIYERVGFQARPAVDLILPASPGSISPEVEPLTEIPPFQIPDRPRAFQVVPSVDQIDWHLERARIYAEILAVPGPPFLGARTADGLALWCANQKVGELYVLLLEGEVAPLLGAAQNAALACGLRAVRVWDCPPFAAGRREPRVGSLPMIRPLHPSVHAERWNSIPRAIWM
jgi:hypothetical protein